MNTIYLSFSILLFFISNNFHVYGMEQTEQLVKKENFKLINNFQLATEFQEYDNIISIKNYYVPLIKVLIHKGYEPIYIENSFMDNDRLDSTKKNVIFLDTESNGTKDIFFIQFDLWKIIKDEPIAINCKTYLDKILDDKWDVPRKVKIWEGTYKQLGNMSWEYIDAAIQYEHILFAGDKFYPSRSNVNKAEETLFNKIKQEGIENSINRFVFAINSFSEMDYSVYAVYNDDNELNRLEALSSNILKVLKNE